MKQRKGERSTTKQRLRKSRFQGGQFQKTIAATQIEAGLIPAAAANPGVICLVDAA